MYISTYYQYNQKMNQADYRRKLVLFKKQAINQRYKKIQLYKAAQLKHKFKTSEKHYQEYQLYKSLFLF